MNNSEMYAGRILKIQSGKRIMKFINDAFDAGKTVYLCTYTNATKFQSKHRAMIKMGKSGSVYVQRGKKWVCADFCKWQAQ